MQRKTITRRQRRDTTSKMIFKSAKNYLVYMVLILSFLYLTGNIVEDIRDTRKKLWVLGETQRNVNQLREDNLRWHLRKDRVTTDMFLQQSIRDRLHLVKEGEHVFVIDEDVLMSPELDAVYEEMVDAAAAQPPPHGWDVWLSWVQGE